MGRGQKGIFRARPKHAAVEGTLDDTGRTGLFVVISSK
jgi:hypothetical protein